MSDARESLLVRQELENLAAPFFPDFDIPEVDRAKPKFHCTGDRLFRDRPDVYKAVVRLLAEPGVTIRTICQECHVTDDLVRSVKARENVSIAHEKKNVHTALVHGLRLASERVIEVMPTASARDALIGVGILTEKVQLLCGDATARIEIAPRVNIHEKIDELHATILSGYEQMKRAHVTEIPADTGVRGENPAQKALTNPDGDNAAGLVETLSHGPCALQEAGT